MIRVLVSGLAEIGPRDHRPAGNATSETRRHGTTMTGRRLAAAVARGTLTADESERLVHGEAYLRQVRASLSLLGIDATGDWTATPNLDANLRYMRGVSAAEVIKKVEEIRRGVREIWTRAVGPIESELGPPGG